MMNKHLNGLLKAEGVIGDKGTSMTTVTLVPFSFPRLMVLKVIEVHCPWHLQCHPGRTTQMDPDVLDDGRRHSRRNACMKIILPIFKDEDAKDAVTYQSWRWNLTVYTGMPDVGIHTLLPYAIRSFQSYPGELVYGVLVQT